MRNPHVWIKAPDVASVVGWFAGLFHLPRIDVNLPIVEHASTRERLMLRGVSCCAS